MFFQFVLKASRAYCAAKYHACLDLMGRYTFVAKLFHYDVDGSLAMRFHDVESFLSFIYLELIIMLGQDTQSAF